MSNIATIKWTRYSVWGFALVILFFMGASELLQVSPNTSAPLDEFSNPVKQSILERLSSLTITNGLGSYQLAKMGDSWRVLKPRNLQARDELVEQIILSLKNLKVRRLYEKDKINLQNFSLHQPTVEMVLAAFGQTQKLAVGLLNPIDDSTYITDSNSSLIYQVDLFKVAIQSLGLGDFINSNIFSESMGEIKKIQVRKHLARRTPTQFALEQKGELWVDRKRGKLDPKKVTDILSKLFGKRAEVILDQRSEELESRIDRAMGRPLYTISLQKNDAQQVIYKVSHPLNSLPDIKLEKKRFVIVTSSAKTPPLLVDKSILDLLNTKAKELIK